MDKDTADKLRGMIRRVTLKNVRDDGETQRASVEVADGIWRDDVEIHQPYGQAGVVPADGALAIALAVGGDEGDMIVLPVGNPSKRMGGLPAGAAGAYNEHGDHVLLMPDGTISIQAGGSVAVSVGGVTFTISAGGVDITGGEVTHDGKNIGSTHVHTGVTPGAGISGTPQ